MVADILVRVSAVLMGLLLITLVAIDFGQVVLRYGFGMGWPWAGDLSIILLLTLAWIGAGHLWLTRGHIAVDLIAEVSRAGRALRVVFDLMVLLGGLILVPMTFRTMQAYGVIDLPALPLPASVKYMPVAVGMCFVVLASALVLVRRLRVFRHG